MNSQSSIGSKFSRSTSDSRFDEVQDLFQCDPTIHEDVSSLTSNSSLSIESHSSTSQSYLPFSDRPILPQCKKPVHIQPSQSDSQLAYSNTNQRLNGKLYKGNVDDSYKRVTKSDYALQEFNNMAMNDEDSVSKGSTGFESNTPKPKTTSQRSCSGSSLDSSCIVGSSELPTKSNQNLTSNSV